jgi:hypothetical protein
MHVLTRVSIWSPDGSTRSDEFSLPSASVEGDAFSCQERQARDVIQRNHVRVTGPTRGDALLADELSCPRSVDHSYHTVIAFSPDLHLTR